MYANTTESLRNVALLGHSGSGKTSLADSMFFAAGGDSRQGKVDEQTSRSDFDPEERRRKMSIQLALLPADWSDHRINILDTPGYPDFRGDAIAGARVADLAIIVVSATSGFEIGTSQAWQLARETDLPVMFVVNKLDRENTEFSQVWRQIAELCGRECAPLMTPVGEGASITGVQSVFASGTDPESEAYQAAAEAIAEADDDLLMRYLDGEALTDDDVRSILKTAFTARQFIPVIPTVATANIGTRELLDTIVAVAPSPAESNGLRALVDGSANLVFKTSADPYVGKMSYFRVFGSPFRSNSHIHDLTSGATERIGQLFSVAGDQTTPVQEVITGDIGVVPKLSSTRTFDTLSEQPGSPLQEPPELPHTAFSMAVSPRSDSDLDKMASALARICEEDPTLTVRRDPETGETILSGLGDMHIESALERINRKFDVALVADFPRIAYRETIFSETTSEYRHKKQSGGHGQYGHVIIQLTPAERGAGITFASKVVGGNVPKEYIPAVEKGIRKAAAEGVIAGYPVVDVHVTLTDGSSHSVDSSGMAFEIAGSMAFKQGVKDASPQLLEPMLDLKVVVPEENAGAVMSDLNGRRARIMNMDASGGFCRIDAQGSAAKMQRYATELRSLTQARGEFTATFAHYEPVPPDYNIEQRETIGAGSA